MSTPARPVAPVAGGGFVVEHRYDRNALVASAVAGRYVVALTEAGSVLRFDRQTMAADGEHWPARRAVALSTADEQGTVLVGFSSGHLARFDPARLAQTPVGQVPGQPVFIVRDPGSARVVVLFGKPIAGPYGWARRGLHQYRARALDGAWETPIEEPSTLLVDRRRRLWLGSDHGEFGGGIQLLALSTGRITEIPWGGSGVYGFTERPDGDVWGFGGTSHMGLSSGYIGRVLPGQKPQVLYGRELMFGMSEGNPAATALVGKEPVGPISHIVTGVGDRLLVVSEDEVFETDVRMKGWKRLAAPSLDVPGGRPDAVGNYPGIRSITLADGKLLLTTIRDGLATLDPMTGEVRSHRLAGQLAVRPESLVVTMAGTVVSGDEAGPAVANADASAPVTAGFRLPPARKRNDERDTRYKMGWGPPRYLPLPGGDVLVIAKWEPMLPRGMSILRVKPDVLVIGVLRNGQLTQIAAEETALEPSDVFTMGEEIWACRGGLYVLRDGAWQRRADAKGLDNVITVPWRRGNSALLLHSRDRGLGLARLTLDGTRARLEPLEFQLDGRPVGVSDALAIDADRVLIATGSALASYQVSAGRVSAVPLTGLDGEAHRLARDGAGRIWIAGRGLWLLDGSRAIDARAAVPAVVDTEVSTLVARGDRLYLALSERGLLVLDAGALAAAALAGRLPPVDPADGTQSHEARVGDHAVFIDLRSPVRWPQSQSWDQRFDAARVKLLAALDRRGVRAVLADDGLEHRGLTLYTDDSSRVLSVVKAVLSGEGLWEHAQITRRLGSRGAVEELVKQTHPDERHTSPQ